MSVSSIPSARLRAALGLKSILYGVAIVICALFFVWRSSKGSLQGRERLTAFALLGLASLGWLAKTFDW